MYQRSNGYSTRLNVSIFVVGLIADIPDGSFSLKNTSYFILTKKSRHGRRCSLDLIDDPNRYDTPGSRKLSRHFYVM